MTEVRGGCVWLTGLSGSGKTTLACAVAAQLTARLCEIVLLDGDELRKTLCAGLGFSRTDRVENIRRIARYARELAQARKLVIVAAITPYAEMRADARQHVPGYIEVWVKAPLNVCINRDPKGLYARAMHGDLPNFTGISDPYEDPEHPDLVVRTDLLPIERCAELIVARVLAECG